MRRRGRREQAERGRLAAVAAHLPGIRAIGAEEYARDAVGAYDRAAARVRAQYGSLLTMVLLQVALVFLRALIDYWLQRPEPPAKGTRFLAGEPGYTDD